MARTRRRGTARDEVPQAIRAVTRQHEIAGYAEQAHPGRAEKAQERSGREVIGAPPEEHFLKINWPGLGMRRDLGEKSVLGWLVRLAGFESATRCSEDRRLLPNRVMMPVFRLAFFGEARLC